MRFLRTTASGWVVVSWATCLLCGAQLRAEPSMEQVNAMIKSGNPQVIPTLRRWLGDASERAKIATGDAKLFVAMNGVAAFRDEKCVRILQLFYKHQTAERTVNHSAAEALSVIGTRDTDLLLKILWDMQLPLKTRCQAAATLVRLDFEVGRQFLLLHYDLYRWEHKTQSGWQMAPVREVLEQLDDAKIIASLSDRLPKESDQRMRNNITTLSETMSLNGQPIEALAKIAENTSWKEGMYQRYPAIRAIGRKGGTELIPLLESLRPWATVDTGAIAGQQRYLKEFADAAVAAIKHRHWKESDLTPSN